MAARAAGILPIGYVGTVANFADASHSARPPSVPATSVLSGGFCIHPDQVPILNAAFSPRPEEVAAAIELIVR